MTTYLVIVSLALEVLACRGSPAPGRSTREATTSDSLYVLVLIDGAPLPWDSGEIREGCRELLVGRWVRLGADRWTTSDSVALTCPAKQPPQSLRTIVSSGRLSREADTVVTEIWGERTKSWLLANRGILRGDTLRMGGELSDGPPEVYIRRRSGP